MFILLILVVYAKYCLLHLRLTLCTYLASGLLVCQCLTITS